MDDLQAALAIPQPWAQSKRISGEQRYALTANGESALGKILLLHSPEYVDVEKAAACTRANDKAGLFRELAKGAKKFIEQHREHSCVPGLDADHLVVLMGLYQIQCEFRAGILNENAETVN